MRFFLVLTGILSCLQLAAQELPYLDSVKYYTAKGQYNKALPFAIENYESVKSIHSNDVMSISATSKLASVYYSLAKFDSAVVYFRKAGERAKQTFGKSSLQYGNILVNLAMIYTESEQYGEALKAFQNATPILNEVESTNKKAYTRYLNAYAEFYITICNLNKAEELCLRAQEIALRAPVDTNAYINVLIKLVKLYGKIGLYSKQETVAKHLFVISKEVYGENNYRHVRALNRLASVYQNKDNLEMADSLYKKALEINHRSVGENAATNVNLLRSIGIVNTEMGRLEIAKEHLEKALEIVNNHGGENSNMFIVCSNNLARLYFFSGDIEQAEYWFQKSLAIYNKLGLELYTGRQMLLYDMAGLLYADDLIKSKIYLKTAMEVESRLLLEKLDFLSEPELLAYSQANKDAADSPYRFLLRHQSPEIAGAAYNSKLLTNSISLQNTRALYQKMTQSADPELTGLWENYLLQKSFYNNLLLTPLAQRNADTDSLAALLNQQEKNILRRSAEYRNMKEKLSVTWQDVQRNLQSDETAIEFVKFTGHPETGGNKKTGVIYYGALLLRPQDTAPKFIVLCQEDQLIDAKKKFPYKAVRNSRGEEAAGFEYNTTNAFYQLLWQPLEPYLKNTRTIYFSPDGLLHRIAFAAIPYKNNALLCDQYNLVQVTSTRQVVFSEVGSRAPISIAMFGGINYSQQIADTSQVSPEAYTWTYRTADLDSFYFLPHTLQEVNTIKANTETLQKKAIAFTADNASEAAFRSLAGGNSPEVIHFATHGFSLPDTATQISNAGSLFRKSDNPLLRCGLVMAGGNKGWKGEAGLNEDDGILTGLEISGVQLPNTQLAVLSACETALGKIEDSEGVFGLQRAFKLAGVNYVMSTLWQVPDKETAEFMEIFYTHWLSGNTIRQSFLRTQQMMRKKYAPYYWAGFTLVQ